MSRFVNSFFSAGELQSALKRENQTLLFMLSPFLECFQIYAVKCRFAQTLLETVILVIADLARIALMDLSR